MDSSVNISQVPSNRTDAENVKPEISAAELCTMPSVSVGDSSGEKKNSKSFASQPKQKNVKSVASYQEKKNVKSVGVQRKRCITNKSVSCETKHSLVTDKLLRNGPADSEKDGEEQEDTSDAMAMLEAICGNFDATIKDKAHKNKLTARNVKSIIKHVITDEHVVSMIRNSVRAEIEDHPDLEQAEYVPKLTRSRVKELKGTSKFPLPGDSPIKLKNGGVTSVLQLMHRSDESNESSPEEDDNSEDVLDDVEFAPHNAVTPVKQSSSIAIPVDRWLKEDLPDNESSSDEEYEPNDGVECESEEEENESFLSTSRNEAGSPPSHCSSPKGFDAYDLNEEQPLMISEPSKNATEDLDNQITEIAHRTRSKLSLNDTPLEVIESTFVAPDISVDMYDTRCNDEEWVNFLRSVQRSTDANVTEDEPEGDDDPEFNFLEEEANMSEEEKNEDLRWDTRTDKAVKVSKRELKELMDELREIAEPGCHYSRDEHVDEVDGELDPCISWSPSKDKFLHTQNDFEMLCRSMTEEEKLQLQQQMRMHVQLLSQTYLLALARPLYSDFGKEAKNMLEDLDILLTSRKLPDGKESFFNAYNLHSALEIVNAVTSVKLPNNTTTGKIAKVTRQYGINSFEVKKILATNKTFIYPDLLPHYGFQTRTYETSKPWFTPAEDRLLILGLEQFSSFSPLSYRCSLISSVLLPAKTAKQIASRIHDVRYMKQYLDHPIRHYLLHNEAPLFPRDVRPFDPNDLKIPAETSLDLLPKWLVAYVKKQNQTKFKDFFKQRSKKIHRPASRRPHRKRRLEVSDQECESEQESSSISSSASVDTPEKCRKEQNFGKATEQEECEPEENSSVSSFIGTAAPVRRSERLKFREATKEVACVKKQNQTKIKDFFTQKSKKSQPHVSRRLCRKRRHDISDQCEREEDASVSSFTGTDTPMRRSKRQKFSKETTEQDVSHSEDFSSSANIDTEEHQERENSEEATRQDPSHSEDFSSSANIGTEEHLERKNSEEATRQNEENDHDFADKYVMKVAAVLKREPSKLQRFLHILCSFEEVTESYDCLYEEVKEIFNEHPLLLQEFALFKLER